MSQNWCNHSLGSFPLWSTKNPLDTACNKQRVCKAQKESHSTVLLMQKQMCHTRIIYSLRCIQSPSGWGISLPSFTAIATKQWIFFSWKVIMICWWEKRKYIYFINCIIFIMGTPLQSKGIQYKIAARNNISVTRVVSSFCWSLGQGGINSTQWPFSSLWLVDCWRRRHYTLWCYVNVLSLKIIQSNIVQQHH